MHNCSEESAITLTQNANSWCVDCYNLFMAENTTNSTLAGPILLFIRGIPGSGKSYLASAMTEKIGAENTIVLDPDMLDIENQNYIDFSNNLTSEGLDSSIHPFRWLRKQACDGISNNKIVLWNQPFTKKGIFERLIKYIEENSDNNNEGLKVFLIEIEVDPEIAKKRVLERKNNGGHGPSENVFAYHVEHHESYANDFNTIKINGTDDIQQSVEHIVKRLSN
jgi:predicted ABC-type ATPase